MTRHAGQLVAYSWYGHRPWLSAAFIATARRTIAEGGASRRAGQDRRHSISAVHAGQRPAGDRLDGPQGSGGGGFHLVSWGIDERAEGQHRLCPSVASSDVYRLEKSVRYFLFTS